MILTTKNSELTQCIYLLKASFFLLFGIERVKFYSNSHTFFCVIITKLYATTWLQGLGSSYCLIDSENQTKCERQYGVHRYTRGTIYVEYYELNHKLLHGALQAMDSICTLSQTVEAAKLCLPCHCCLWPLNKGEQAMNSYVSFICTVAARF